MGVNPNPSSHHAPGLAAHFRAPYDQQPLSRGSLVTTRSSRIAVLTFGLLALTQVTIGAQAAPPAISADSKDVASADAIIAALYDVISGPLGQKRNWDRFRSLFVPGARLIPTSVAADMTRRIRVMTPDEYATASGSRLEQAGFFEREISRTGETFGNVTHAFSTYESRRAAADDKPFARGINSIQLFNDGARWWIVTVYWDSERKDNPLPAKYLKER